MELKGRLTIIKPSYKYGDPNHTCKQIINISNVAYREMNRYGVERVFSSIMNDLGGFKWTFEKID